MSDLQLALLGVGVLLVAGVLALNKWQEKKLRGRLAASLPPAETDALLDTPAVERRRAEAETPRDLPAVDAAAPAGEASVDHTLGLPPLAPAPVAEAAVDTPAASMPQAAPPEPGGMPTAAPTHALDARAPRPALLDPRVDFIATLLFATPVSGEEVLRQAGAVIVAAKPIAWEGRSAGGVLEELAAGGFYTDVRCGMQMLDRRGVASEPDIVAFSQSVQALAATLAAEASFPSRRDALRLAAALDQVTADADIQVALSVVHPTGIAAAKVRAAAESEGCILGADGRFHLYAADGAEIFSVGNAQGPAYSEQNLGSLTSRAIAITFDVPHAPPTGEAFTQFVRFAERLATVIGGQLVDDNGRVVAPSAMLAIANAVKEARGGLLEAEVPAGSALARRLFR